MKKLIIEIKINDGESNSATTIQTNGFSNENISNQFELLGILENTKDIINERIKKLLDIRN